MSLWLERFSPALVSAAAGAVYVAFLRDNDVPVGIHDLFTATISIAAIAVGFFAVAKTSVVQLADESKLISGLKATGRYEYFMSYMSSALHVSFTLAVLSAAGLLITFTDVDGKKDAFLAVWTFAAVFSLCSYIRVVRILNVVLDSR